MSETTASLSHKINSAGELKSVVRTMKALAASSVGQYEQSVLALADYYRTVQLGLSACFRGKQASGFAGGTQRPGRRGSHWGHRVRFQSGIGGPVQ